MKDTYKNWKETMNCVRTMYSIFEDCSKEGDTSMTLSGECGEKTAAPILKQYKKDGFTVRRRYPYFLMLLFKKLHQRYYVSWASAPIGTYAWQLAWVAKMAKGDSEE